MIFKQLFEELSSTYTYLIACEDTGQAVLIDPVYNAADRDLSLLADLGLKLVYTVETHIHADHITAALKLKHETGCQMVFPVMSKCNCADVGAEEGKPITIGSVSIDPLFTPGHTDDHCSYLLDGRVLTGDALLIDGCGRTDFQNGDAHQLYRSIRDKLFVLPDDTLVFPGHDYQQRHVSSIIQEKRRNPRLGQDIKEEEFIEIMKNLDLAYPKFIEHAVPGNQKCGVCPDDLPNNMEVYCGNMTESPQG